MEQQVKYLLVLEQTNPHRTEWTLSSCSDLKLVNFTSCLPGTIRHRTEICGSRSCRLRTQDVFYCLFLFVLCSSVTYFSYLLFPNMCWYHPDITVFPGLLYCLWYLCENVCSTLGMTGSEPETQTKPGEQKVAEFLHETVRLDNKMSASGCGCGCGWGKV